MTQNQIQKKQDNLQRRREDAVNRFRLLGYNVELAGPVMIERDGNLTRQTYLGPIALEALEKSLSAINKAV